MLKIEQNSEFLAASSIDKFRVLPRPDYRSCCDSRAWMLNFAFVLNLGRELTLDL